MNNYYDEYLYVNGRWELIGSTDVDLTNYYTKAESDGKYVEQSSLATVASSGSYVDLSSKPTIESVELSGNKTFLDLKIDEANISKRGVPYRPQNFTIGWYDLTGLSVGDNLPQLSEGNYVCLDLPSNDLWTNKFKISGALPTNAIFVYDGYGTQKISSIVNTYDNTTVSETVVELDFTPSYYTHIVFNFRYGGVIPPPNPKVELVYKDVKLNDFIYKDRGEAIGDLVTEQLTVGERIYGKSAGNNSVVIGKGTASGKNSFAQGGDEGYSCYAEGNYSHAEGYGSFASGTGSHAEGGGGSIASGNCSHSEGYSCRATGDYSHAEGSSTKASGSRAHSEGDFTEATGNYSHAEGQASKATGESSHAEGGMSYATGNFSHAEGKGAMAYGNYSHVEGEGCYAYHNAHYSHVEGQGTMCNTQWQHVQGKYNVTDTDGYYAHIVGNGSDSNNCRNIHTLNWTGEAWFKGDVYTGSTSGANKDSGSKKLATEAYVLGVLPSNFVGTDGSSAGTAGLVPAPATTDANKFLNANGTWATPPSGAQYTAGDYIDITNNEISVTGIVSTGGGGTSLTLVEGQYYKVEYTGDTPQLITEANSGYYMVENTTNANKEVAIQFSSAINNDLYVAFVVDTQDEVKTTPDSWAYQNNTGSIYYFEDRAIGTNLEPGEKLVVSCQSTNTYPPSAILCNLTNEQTIQYVDGYYADGTVGYTIQISASQNWRYYVYENTGNAGTFGLEITGDSSDSSLYVVTDSNDEILLNANSDSANDGYFGVYLNQGDKVYINVCYPDASTSVKVYAGDPPAVLDNYALKTEVPTDTSDLTNSAGFQTASDINSKFTYGTSDLTPGTSPLAEGNFYFVYE